MMPPQLVDNALPQVQGTEVGMKLLKIRRQLLEVQKGLWRVPAHPGEVAHFTVRPADTGRYLHLVAPGCSEGLGVRGYHPHSPAPRLFLRQLEAEGEDERRCWVRDEAAATGTPMVIDPKHTTVAVVVNKSDKVRSLLAGNTSSGRYTSITPPTRPHSGGSSKERLKRRWNITL